jgi:CDP-diacylglycerol--glycerol-3-phosphate 3-phosphatidyltransferase
MSQQPAERRTDSPSAPSVWNIANALTMLRIVLVPLFGWLLLADGGHDDTMRMWSFVAFLIAILTDRFDGDIARRRGLVTDFGKLTDPIADKALTGMAFIGLSIIDELSWWVTIVVLARELAITLLRFVVIKYAVIPASRGGKLKTFLQSIAILLYLLPVGGVVHWLAIAFMTAAVVTTVVTGVDYLLQAIKLVRRGRPADSVSS